METDGGALETLCYLAEKLGKSLDEVRAFPNADITILTVYYGRKAQRQEIAAAHGRR